MNNELPTLEEKRELHARPHRMAGHKRFIAGALLIVGGTYSATQISDSTRYIADTDYRNKSSYSQPSVMKKSFTAASYGLTFGALGGLISGLGLAFRSQHYYGRATAHTDGSNDRRYNPDHYTPGK